MNNNENNDFNSNQNGNSNVVESDIKYALIFIGLSVISVFLFFFSNTSFIFDMSIVVASLIGSIVMVKKKKKYAIFSLIISLVVIIFHIISFFIATKEISGVLNSTRVSAFKETAFNFISEVYRRGLSSGEIYCDENGQKEFKESLPTDMNGGITSPFGGKFDLSNSYVLIQSNMNNGTCQYKKFIYLTDGKYSLGEFSSPILEDEIDGTDLNQK